MTATTFEIKPGRLFIGGEHADASSGETMPVINPATEQVVSTVAKATRADAERAVVAARDALESNAWRGMPAHERGRLLFRLSQLIRERNDEIAFLETTDVGKPISESSKIDVPMVADIFEYYAGLATKVHGETLPVRGNHLCYTLREPIGVVAAITPWNFPLLLSVWKIAPALATGCTVVHKPSSDSPLTALKLAELVREAGFPPGVLNVVTGPGREVGDALVTHPLVDKIAFTGETETGKRIMRAAADGLKRVTLELGGKSPNIVLDDADVEAAVRGAQIGIFYNKGEVCAAGSRLLVADKVHDQLVEKLIARTKKLVPGDPLDPKTRFGPVASRGQVEKVLGYVAKGKAEGAKLLTGGERVDAGPVKGKGYFITPAVFDGVKNDMTIAREEIFGPVLATIRFSDVEEAIKLANDSPYGLASAVWTRDVRKAHYVASRLKAGTVWVNTYNQYDPAAPFGGYKQSGFGRELGAQAVEHYTQLKTVWVDLNG